MDDGEKTENFLFPPPALLVEAMAKKVLFQIERGLRQGDEGVWKNILEKGRYDQLTDEERGTLNEALRNEGLWLVPPTSSERPFSRG